MLSLSLHTCIRCPWQEVGKTGGNGPQGHGERDDRITEAVELCNKLHLNCHRELKMSTKFLLLGHNWH